VGFMTSQRLLDESFSPSKPLIKWQLAPGLYCKLVPDMSKESEMSVFCLGHWGRISFYSTGNPLMGRFVYGETTRTEEFTVPRSNEEGLPIQDWENQGMEWPQTHEMPRTWGSHEDRLWFA
jgi:hypothetical protein